VPTGFIQRKGAARVIFCILEKLDILKEDTLLLEARRFFAHDRITAIEVPLNT
jgi:hypothetical protein